MRETALRDGLDGFHPHQVLEFLLFYALPRQDTSTLAHQLLDRFGSLEAVLNADSEKLMQIQGIGRRTAEWIQKLGSLVDCYTKFDNADRPRIVHLADAYRFARNHVQYSGGEAMWQVCLSSAGYVQSIKRLLIVDGIESSNELMDCLGDVLSLHTRNVLLIRCVEQSIPDFRDGIDSAFVENYRRILNALGVELLDTILVGTEEMRSYRKESRLKDTAEKTGNWSFAEEYLNESP